MTGNGRKSSERQKNERSGDCLSHWQWLVRRGRREAPPDQQTDQTVRGKGMSKNNRKTRYKFREIHDNESEKYMSENERNTQEKWQWLAGGGRKEAQPDQQQTDQTVRGKGRKLEMELSRMWMVCLAFLVA